ncbi:MAG: hypothetical protein HFJ35_02480 [Clostridia bacterium]|nr:hypothetical protein [Clostridia bacterium]
MEKINFEDGQLEESAYVTINGVKHNVVKAKYTGSTPLSAFVLNKMQENIEKAIEEKSSLPEGGTIGQVLAKASNEDNDVEWIEQTGGGNITGDTLPIGATIEWHSDIIPENWLLCDGQAVSRIDYSELFKVLGTKYGTGNGSTTFNLPNLKGKVAVGKDENDSDFNALGKNGGEKEHTLTIKEMPKHNHNYIDNNSNRFNVIAGMRQGGSNEINQGGGGKTYDYFYVDYAGNGQPHNNLQPYIACNFIIKAKQSSGLVATVVDNLESTSETDALSAKQGKILKEMMQRHIITAKGKTGTTLSATSSGIKVSLTEATQVGTKLTLSNGGIKIGTGVKKISITATTVFVNGSTGSHALRICKNNNTSEDNLLARTMLNTVNGTDVQEPLNIVRRIVDNASEGDIIYMYVTSNPANEVSAPLSMLTVEVVE